MRPDAVVECPNRGQEYLKRLVSRAGNLVLVFWLVCLPVEPQQHPLLGRWEGKVRTPQGQQLRATANFTKEGERYGGTISGFDARLNVDVLGGRTGGHLTRTFISLQAAGEVPFKKVELDKDGVDANFEVRGPQGTIAVGIRFVFKGDTLQGRSALILGGQSLTLNYDLKRAVGPLPAPSESAHSISVPAEAAEFEKIVAEADPAARKQLIGSFAEEYPDPHLLRYLRELGTHPEVQDKGAEMKDKTSSKSLAPYANDYVLLTDLADAYVRGNRINTAAPMAVRALELISSTRTPTHLSDEKWIQNANMLMAKNFTTLGFVQLRRAQDVQDPVRRRIEAEKSLTPFQKALEYHPRNAYALYGLGSLHYELGSYSLAETNLAKAAAIEGPVSLEARSKLEELFRVQRKSMDELDPVIARAKNELEIP